MSSFKMFLLFFLLNVVLRQLCTAQDSIRDARELSNGKDKPQVHFLYGNGGPIRESLVCFPKEYLFMSIKVPEDLMPKTTYMGCDWSFTSHTSLNGKNYVLRNPRTVVFQSVLPAGLRSSFMTISQPIPSGILEGKYDLNVKIKDLDNGELFVDLTNTIEIMSDSVFGFRDVSFMHGYVFTGSENMQAAWSYGSNVFVAGERVAVKFFIGGVRGEKNVKSDVKTTLTLSDEAGHSVEIFGKSHSLEDWMVSRGSLRSTDADIYPIPITQPGRYKVKIEVRDLNSSEWILCELPLLILPLEREMSASSYSKKSVDAIAQKLFMLPVSSDCWSRSDSLNGLENHESSPQNGKD